MRFLIIFTLLLSVGAAHAQDARPWYESAETVCCVQTSLHARVRDRDRYQDRSKSGCRRIFVKLLSRTEANAFIWYSDGSDSWTAMCKVTVRPKFRAVVLALERHRGWSIPPDQGIDMTAYHAAYKAKRDAPQEAKRRAVAPPSKWTNEKAIVTCTQDLRRLYGKTLSVVSFMGKQPHENSTTLVGLLTSDTRAKYKEQQVTVGCIYRQDGALFTIFFNSKIANWIAPSKKF